MAAVAEELRNPLAPIRIASAMLGRCRPTSRCCRACRRIVEQQLARMSRLVGHLVDASATRAGRAGTSSAAGSTWRRSSTPPSPACQPLMDSAPAALRVAPPGRRAGRAGDATRLEQVVGNLLDNASRAHAGRRPHRPVGRRPAATVTLTVSDDGIGITPQALPAHLRALRAGHPALGYNGVGLGIGLTVVRALVRAHGGDIVAHSAGPGAAAIRRHAAAGGDPAAEASRRQRGAGG